jgi:hypothetical protein
MALLHIGKLLWLTSLHICQLEKCQLHFVLLSMQDSYAAVFDDLPPS